MNLQPLSGDRSEEVFCQNGLAKGFPLGYHSGLMIRCIALEETHHVSVHLLAQASDQLAARTPTDVPSSASPGVLLVAGVPSDLPGKRDSQRAGAVGPASYCR